MIVAIAEIRCSSKICGAWNVAVFVACFVGSVPVFCRVRPAALCFHACITERVAFKHFVIPFMRQAVIIVRNKGSNRDAILRAAKHTEAMISAVT
jgi:hypothetical protein